MEEVINETAIVLDCGDITKEATDAIVTAANSRLAGGGGVDGAIHQAGGLSIMSELRKLTGCPTGDAVITKAGNLKARYVIHAVGPIYRGGSASEAKFLQSAYRKSLELALQNNLQSISFPAISTGVYGYPVAEAARLALQTCIVFAREKTGILLIRHILYDRRVYEVFSIEFKKLLEPQQW